MRRNKITFLTVFFFNKSYMHCILSNWMNKSHWSTLLDVFYIVSDFHLLWIAKYETDQTCNFLQLIKLIGILHRFVFAGSIFCLSLCLKICVDFKECLATIIRRFFFLVETACNRLVWMVIVQQSEAVHIGIKYLSSVRTRIIAVC